MSEIINKFLNLIEQHPKYSKVVGFLLVALSIIYLAMQFSSCSLVQPAVQNKQLGAEGVVSKEKNVSRTTKWYYRDKDAKGTDSLSR